MDEPLVNDIVCDPDGTRNEPHSFETLGPNISDGFCKRCGRDALHPLHAFLTDLGRVVRVSCEHGSTFHDLTILVPHAVIDEPSALRFTLEQMQAMLVSKHHCDRRQLSWSVVS